MNKLCKKLVSIIMVLSLILLGVEPIVVEAGEISEVTETSSVMGEDYDEDDDYYDTESENESEIENDQEIDIVSDRIEVSFNVTSKWHEHYNVDVQISNTSGEAIDDWEIQFSFKDTIENIWNGIITSHEGDTYVIRNADWNQDIPVDGKVTFGMTVKYSGEIELPDNYVLTKDCLEVEGGYTVEYKENSSWDNYVNGQIVITNNSDHRIEDWKLDLNSNLEIQNVWNASIVSKYDNIYRLDNAGYNQNIEIGQSVEFGFIAKCDEEVNIRDYVLNEMTDAEYKEDDFVFSEDDTDVESEDEDDENDLSEETITYPKNFVFEPDDFETYEEYLDHVGVSSISTMSLLRTAVPTKNVLWRNKIQFVTKDDKRATGISKAIQNYCIDGNTIYTLQGRKGRKKHVVIRKGTYDSNSKVLKVKQKYYTLKNFAHGQTFEQFHVNDKSSFILEGNASTMWGNQLILLDYETITKKAVNKEFIFKSEYGKRLKDFAYANKAGKLFSNKGLKRVHAALSTDKKYLAIWCQSNDNEKIQVSVYDFKKIKKYLYGIGKGNKEHKYFSFRENKAKAKDFCVFSNICDKANNVYLKPADSFQSMDISNEFESGGKWYLYLCGGNEAKNKANGLQITRVTINKDEKKIQNEKKIKVNPTVKKGGEIVGLGGYREIEGCHINKSKLDFLITKSNTTDKNPQYIYTIKKSVFN